MINISTFSLTISVCLKLLFLQSRNNCYCFVAYSSIVFFERGEGDGYVEDYRGLEFIYFECLLKVK